MLYERHATAQAVSERQGSLGCLVIAEDMQSFLEHVRVLVAPQQMIVCQVVLEFSVSLLIGPVDEQHRLDASDALACTFSISFFVRFPGFATLFVSCNIASTIPL